MAHTFDVLSTFTRHLNLISRHYTDNDGKSLLRELLNIPTFIITSIDRAANIEGMIIDPNENLGIETAIIADTDDKFNPVYMVVVDNLKKPIVDKVSVIVSRKDIYGPGVAYIVALPKLLFLEETSFEENLEILRDIYYGFLDLDTEMQYSSSSNIINLSKSSKVYIPAYDLQMFCVALCCINATILQWYSIQDKNDDYLARQIGKGVSDRFIPNLSKVLDKYTNIAEIRDGLGSGAMIHHLMYGK